MKKAYITDQFIMSMWDYLLDHKVVYGDYEIYWRKTNQAFCQNLKYNGKNVGCLYIFGLKEYGFPLLEGYVARFYINPKHRSSGMAFAMFDDVIKNFGHCVLYISSVSPNRIEGLNDENREYYRNKLYKFYSHFGFERTSDKYTGMIRSTP